MKTLKIIFAGVLIKLLSSPVGGGREGALFAQQDPQYSQYMFNQLALNPACAGSREVLAAALVHRNQWVNIDGAPTTGTFSLQMPLRNKKMGVGTEIIADRIGPKKINAFLVSYSYRLLFPKSTLAFGLRAGIYNYSFSWNKMRYQNMNDVVYANGLADSKKTSGNADFGMHYYTHTFYWGLGITHLNKGKITNLNSDTASKQAPHFFMPVSKAFEVGNTILNPSLLIKMTENVPPEMDLSLNVLLKDRWWLGVSLRSAYGIVFLTQLQVTEKFKIGYSFDLGSNKIGTVGKATHEIMVGYDINILGTKIATPRYL